MAMMISKFHKIIQSKVVWTAFAILISVAFVGVYTGSKTAGAKQQKELESAIAGRLYGEDVSRREYGTAYKNVYVMYSMMTGRALSINDEIDEVITQAAWQRLATLKKARQMGLNVTPEQVVNMIKRQSIFQNQQTGQYDANAYNAFVNGFLRRNASMTAKGFESMMAENVLLEKASASAAQGALVTEDEIKKRFHLYNDKLTVDYAPIPRSIAGTIKISEEEAKAYFDQNQEQFRMPEKAIVHYVQFAVADYAGTVSVTDEMVAQVYENNKQRYLKPAVEGAPEGAAPEFQPLEEVKDSIVEVITSGLAHREATNAADTLVSQLSDESTTFLKETEKAGLKVVSNTPAFGATDPVKGVDSSAPFARAAFQLEKDASHYYSDPVVGRDFVYVIALEKKLPSFLPAFDLVQADVMEAAKIAASEAAYLEKAEAAHTAIEKSLESGVPFADAAALFNLELKQTVPFSISSPLENELSREIMAATVQFDASTLVDLIPTTDEFLIAYIASKDLASETETLPAMQASLADRLRNEKAAALAQAWQKSVLKEANLEDLRNSTSEES